MNKIILSGRLCADISVRYTQDGKPIVTFNFAVSRPYLKNGNQETDFFNCVSFGKTAETMERLHIGKGTKLLLEGRVQNDDYTDREGVKRHNVRVIVDSFEFCEKKADTPRAAAPAPTPQGEEFMNIPDNIDEELPFA